MLTKIFSAVVSSVLLMTLSGASVVSGAPLTVYSNNFDGIEIFAAGVTGGLSGITGTVGVEGFAGLGSVGNQFSGNLLLNGSGDLARFNVTPTPTTLTLSNLPAHTSLDVNFLLAIIDSWDSTNGLIAPDFLQISIDGIQVIQATFANCCGTVTNPIGTDVGSGALQRGFNPNWLDRAYDAGTDSRLNVPHTASTVTFSIRAAGSGWQGTGNPLDGFDEAWGIENLNVIVNTNTGVPEPASVVLVGIGLVGLAIKMRYRQRFADRV